MEPQTWSVVDEISKTTVISGSRAACEAYLTGVDVYARAADIDVYVYRTLSRLSVSGSSVYPTHGLTGTQEGFVYLRLVTNKPWRVARQLLEEYVALDAAIDRLPVTFFADSPLLQRRGRLEDHLMAAIGDTFRDKS